MLLGYHLKQKRPILPYLLTGVFKEVSKVQPTVNDKYFPQLTLLMCFEGLIIEIE